MVVKSALWVLFFALLAQNTKQAPLTSKPVDKAKPNNVNKYKIYIIQPNHNVTLEEDLVIDTRRGTEIFLIPKHKLEVFKDFSKKLDIIFDGKRKTCYVSRQQLFEARPVALKSLMENKSIYTNDDLVSKDTTTWKVDAVFTHRSLLSEKMAALCARSSIYWIQKIKGTGSVIQSRDTEFFKDPRSLCVSYLCWYVTEYRIVTYWGRRILHSRKVKRCRRIVC
ncbi:uncharacterized protein LOC116292438 isoform X3 [Actinia tenebrosa]|uniref:Uncharacterized protein LOC116292438 isoform X3 n=1 Tax=Actinia tenebrosa TaxID=6105 RepID=A0A6P8HSH6_ACTTE|nr:uncharacterized protein LOC116292438 isoform X3 [Actinia tenebrosa]XP_031555625.1 uncharacterized protein LOC116292438 isoform X3 [Actinia tenebrosa]